MNKTLGLALSAQFEPPAAETSAQPLTSFLSNLMDLEEEVGQREILCLVDRMALISIASIKKVCEKTGRLGAS